MARKPLPDGVTEDDLRRATARGQEAQALLDNPLLTDALERLQQQYVASWQNSLPIEHEKRDAAYWGQINLRAFRAELEKAVDAAAVARAELRIRSLAE